jgi:hypothetical protein
VINDNHFQVRSNVFGLYSTGKHSGQRLTGLSLRTKTATGKYLTNKGHINIIKVAAHARLSYQRQSLYIGSALCIARCFARGV